MEQTTVIYVKLRINFNDSFRAIFNLTLLHLLFFNLSFVRLAFCAHSKHHTLLSTRHLGYSLCWRQYIDLIGRTNKELTL